MRRCVSWSAPCLAFALGCGGVAKSTAAPDAGSRGLSTAGIDAGEGLDAGSSPDAYAPGFVCPSASPTGGGPCPVTSEACEYGSSPYFVCDTVARCELGSDGGWTWGVVDGADSSQCASQTSACADTQSVTDGGACPVTLEDPFFECDLPGESCSCAASSAWSCQPTPSGCPAERPRLGSLCDEPTPPGTVCSYAGGLSLACDDGNWVDRPNP
jgi:hypothetical protein